MPNADSFDVQDTIAALATATGQGGVGIIRVSGPDALSIAQSVIGFQPTPRHAHFTEFFDDQGLRIDQGIALFFEGPNSFTGEDVFELQGHGGPVVMDILLRTVVSKGARIAEPGEFSKRAFLNDKLDLVQAEAIADLISSTSEQAARCAMRSLQGQFSKEIENVVAKLIKLRMFVEAAIDFPEEEIDFIADSNVLTDLDEIKQELLALLENANQGSLMTEGVKVVIAGRPNAGKSSLLNALAGRETAIVTDIAGTTRDVLKEQIHIDGMPLHLVDTAGLRDSDDEVERIGIERAWTEINEADIILLVHDAREAEHPDQIAWQNDFIAHIQRKDHLTLIRNKVDLVGAAEAFDQVSVQGDNLDRLSISAKQMIGIDLLRDHLKKMVGFKSNSEGMFTARRRHLDALESALDLMEMGRSQLVINQAGELLAEDLRQAQEALGTITGKFSADDLLGEIFGTFCIGK